MAHLGELDAQGRAKAKTLAHQITGGAEQNRLFETPIVPQTAVAVRLDRIRIERGRAFGAVWLGSTLWRALGLDRLCEELLPEGREAVPWSRGTGVGCSDRGEEWQSYLSRSLAVIDRSSRSIFRLAGSNRSRVSSPIPP